MMGDLASAASGALDGVSDQGTGQTALVPAVRIKFVGASKHADILEKPPEEDQELRFLVTAVCVGGGWELRKDGEHRDYSKMEVSAIRLITGDAEIPVATPPNE